METMVKYMDGICAKFCLKLWFEGDWYFVILLSQDGFKCNQETNVLAITL